MATEEWKKEVQKHEQYIKDLEGKYKAKCEAMEVTTLDWCMVIRVELFLSQIWPKYPGSRGPLSKYVGWNKLCLRFEKKASGTQGMAKVKIQQNSTFNSNFVKCWKTNSIMCRGRSRKFRQWEGVGGHTWTLASCIDTFSYFTENWILTKLYGKRGAVPMAHP